MPGDWESIERILRGEMGYEPMPEPTGPRTKVVVLHQPPMPDITPAMILVSTKVVAAVALIVGLNLSPEKSAAIAFLVAAASAMILKVDGNVREARNFRLGSENTTLAEVHSQRPGADE